MVIGETIDDAAGEAFDKSAKLLGLPYPGGPLIDKNAKMGNPLRYSFPEPQIPSLDFSFSGLKTAILYFIRNEESRDANFLTENMNDVCASIQHRIVSILLNKLRKASLQSGIKDVSLAGGVSANSGLRTALTEMGIREGWRTFIPAFEYCTDNAAMIAITGYYNFIAGRKDELTIKVSARAEW
jgi:N6-L-threonylcarbamoyladenine synthase